MVKKSAENPVSAENPTMSSPIVICHQYPTNPHEISIKSNHFPSAIHSNPHFFKKNGEIPSTFLHDLAFSPHVLSMQIYLTKKTFITKKSRELWMIYHDISIETSINLGYIH